MQNMATPVTLGEIVTPVENDLQILDTNLKESIGERHPLLLAAAEQIFGAGGKRLRPLLVLLIARATAENG